MRSTYYLAALFSLVFAPTLPTTALDNIPTNDAAAVDIESIVSNAMRPDNVDTQTWFDIIRRFRKRMSMNGPISFSGRVVDTETRPVSGALVTGYVMAYDENFLKKLGPFGTEEKEIPWLATCDDNGEFRVTGLQGLTLTVTNIAHEGYTSPPVRSSFSFVHHEYSDNPQPESIAAPFAFVIISDAVVAADEDLRKIEIEASLVADDTPAYFDLTKTRRVDPSRALWDMAVKVNRLDHDLQAKKFDWTITISSTNSSFIEAPGTRPYVAPGEGYQTQLVFRISKDDPNWRDYVMDRLLYVKLRDNSLFASALLNIYIARQTGVICRINSTVNTAGQPFLFRKD